LRRRSRRSNAAAAAIARGGALVLAILGTVFLPAGPAVAYEEVAVTDGGELRGVVRFSGTPPKLEPIRVNKNRDVCGETKPSEALVLGADRAVRGAVVAVEAVTRGKKPAGELVIDNLQCLFVPHVSAIMAGAAAKVKNSDPVLHNTHGFHGKPTIFNLALPNAKVLDITRKLTKPGVVRMLCDAHTHMFGWIYVHDSPYVAVTDDAGRFRIDGIPPGKYKVTMWHEGFVPRGADKDGRPLYDDPRSVTREVSIAAKGTATLDFELK
jgi:plastocyanin